MKNFALLSLVVLSLLAGSSCDKHPATPISYLIDTVGSVYLNYDDSLHQKYQVRFLTGNITEDVTLTISGLPSNVKLVKDTLTGQPTFTADFILYSLPTGELGYYPVTLWVYTHSTGWKAYPFTLGVVHYHCPSYLSGVFTCSNACHTNYVYSATSTPSGDTAIHVSNFGGYGPTTTTVMNLNCNTDSVTIFSQNIGNGVAIRGQGHFEANKIVVKYEAFNLPGGFNDTCVAVMTK